MAYVSLDSEQIKRAHKKHKYTKDQVLKLEQCMQPKSGPLFFMETFMKIQHPTKGEMEFHPYPFQKRLIESYNNNRFSISMLPRQTGKTTCAAGYIIWYAMFHPNSSILIAAHKYAGASDIMSRVRYSYEMLPEWIKAGVVQYNRNSIEFDNGSKIMATTTTENTGRGMSLTMIYCDEFAFVQPPDKAKEFWTSLSPTLSTGGKCKITSTPNSDEDQFAMIWKEANKRFDEYGNDKIVGTNGFYAMKAHWSEHPDRDETWAETEKARIGEERFRREHECEFIIFDETLINSITLADMEGTNPVENTGQVRWFKRPTPGHTYMVALDPSMGTGGDFAAIQIFELPTFDQVGEWRHNGTPMNQQIKILQGINKQALTKSSCCPGLALKLRPVATKSLSSVTSNLELTFNLLFSTSSLNFVQASILCLAVVLNPLLNFLLCPLLIGSDKNIPIMFSSPISITLNKAASPIALFSIL